MTCAIRSSMHLIKLNNLQRLIASSAMEPTLKQSVNEIVRGTQEIALLRT